MVDYFFRFAHPWIAIFLISTLLILLWLRKWIHKPIRYKYSLVGAYRAARGSNNQYVFRIPVILRFIILCLLALLIARPQLVDVKSKINVKGIDIMLILDVSGSMQCFDDIKDQRSRFTVAKEEAIRFIEKRENDPIGLILFGKDAISRCPLTLDTNILNEIMQNLQIGTIDPDGTVLSTAIAMGVQRLRKSKAKSKIMIVLTDGEPTPGLDIEPDKAINLAKKFGIKVYTIGIGGEHGGLWKDPLFGITAMGFPINKKLLLYIAQETGGNFFHAKSPEEVKRIYDIIDSLEKTEYETTIFSNYYDLIVQGVLLVFGLLLFEKILTTFVWFVI